MSRMPRSEWEGSDLFKHLVRLPGRCRWCAYHPALQGHRFDCPIVPRSRAA